MANSAHEVRTPLNAIINYLEIALEGALDQETRDNLAKSHSASKSLIYVINDLLDLTKTEEGHDLVKDEIFDLPATIREATDSFTGDAKRKQLEYAVNLFSLPHHVVGDQRRVRQAISNVTANAIQHTSTGAVKVEACLVAQVQDRVDIDVSVQDTGVGMSPKKLDALFRELEQVQSESDEGLQEKLAPTTKAIAGGGGQRTLGLGLALVARIIRNMNGQLRLKSEEGKGSRFVMQFNFCLPDNEAGQTIEIMNSSNPDLPKLPQSGTPSLASRETFQSSEQHNADTAYALHLPTTPPNEIGEVVLVNKSAQKGMGSSTRDLARKVSKESLHSQKSIGSLKSFKSGSSARIDVDRLIDAIQEPAMSAKPEDSQYVASRSVGRGSRPSSLSSRPQSAVMRSHSLQSFSNASPTPQNISGESNVQDSKTPIRPIRVPAEESADSASVNLAPRTPARVLFDIPGESDKSAEPLDACNLHVLVAEDDPINSKILKKRLEKLGHTIDLTVNGEECSSMYGERPTAFDVVLMDMQVSGLQLLPAHYGYHAKRSSRCLLLMVSVQPSSSGRLKKHTRDRFRNGHHQMAAALSSRCRHLW